MKTRAHMQNMSTRMAATVALLFVIATGWSEADGFRNPPEGAAALARGGVRLTQGDDPTTISHNPANLMDVEGAQITPTLSLGYSKTKFTNTLGMSEETKDPWRALPGLYGSWTGDDDSWRFGVGINLPYGQSTEWDANGVFRVGAPYYAEMMTLNVTPAVAKRLGDRVSVGAGLNLMWSNLEFRQNLPWLPMPGGLTGPVSDLGFEGDGYGIGAKLGITWQMTENQRLAFVYQTPVSITYEGDFTINNPPPPGSLPPTATTTSDFETELNFPSMVGLGYGIQATETLRLEANVEWIEHSRNDSLDLDIANNNAILVAAMGSTSIAQDWDDEWVIGLGADWQANEICVVRAGWTYLPSPIPDETYMSTLPDGDRNIIGLGVGLGEGPHILDLAYALTLVDDVTISTSPNPAVNGVYEFDVHLMSATYSYTF